MAGVDLVSVKEILGHRDIQTTIRYAHRAPGHLRDSVNRGSLSGTVTKTVTSLEGKREEKMPPIDYLVRPEGLEPPTLGSIFTVSTANSCPLDHRTRASGISMRCSFGRVTICDSVGHFDGGQLTEQLVTCLPCALPQAIPYVDNAPLSQQFF